MRVLQIATVGEDTDPVFVGIKEYPVSKLILIHTKEQNEDVMDITSKLSPLKLDIERVMIRENLLIEVLQEITNIVNNESMRYDDIYINVGSGTKIMSCAALSAAFVNGIKAIHVMNDMPILLPVLKFSYNELISDAKLNILKAINDSDGEINSLTELSKQSGIEKSLLSYHIRGGKEHKGLRDLGMLTVESGVQGRLTIKMTELGNLLLVGRGY